MTVTEEFTALAAKRYDLRLGREATQVSGEPGALRITLDDDTSVAADTLLVAVGRVPNGDRMSLDAAGIDVDDAGRIVVDAHQRTTAEGVWALGDVCTSVPLKHVANREADVVRHNLRHPDDLVGAGHDLVPAAIFTHPQIAAIGATEQDLRDRDVDYRVGLARYGDTAYGWAMEDDTGFCKVLVDPAASTILGAHIMGQQAADPPAAARARGHARHHRPHPGRAALLDPPRAHRGGPASPRRRTVRTDALRRSCAFAVRSSNATKGQMTLRSNWSVARSSLTRSVSPPSEKPYCTSRETSKIMVAPAGTAIRSQLSGNGSNWNSRSSMPTSPNRVAATALPARPRSTRRPCNVNIQPG